MKFTKFIVIAMMICSLMFGMIACSEEGPAEKAGKKIDKAVDDAKDSVKKVFE